jgi:uncharacterized membrane protein YqjE
MHVNEQAPGISTLIGRVAHTALGALHNRGELLVVEWQEEKSRLLAALLWSLGALFLSMVGLVLATAFVIFLFPPDTRLYATGGFALLYLAAGAAAYFALRSRLKQEPFSETIRQVRKDADVLESFR